MNLEKTLTWSRWAGSTGSICCILLFLIIIDALVSRLREPPNLFSGLPGDRLAVSGPLREKTDQVRELVFQTNSPDIRLEFKAIQAGFWLGGHLWNGTLNISPRTPPGEYLLRVQSKNSPEEKSSSLFLIRVYGSPSELQLNSKSYLVWALGIEAWPAGLSLLFMIIFAFGLVYYLSHKTEILLAEQGKAEVYQVRREEAGCEIFFGLGRQQGLQAGNELLLIDHQGKPLGSIFVGEVFENHSTALVDPDLEIRPGFIVSRSRPVVV